MYSCQYTTSAELLDMARRMRINIIKLAYLVGNKGAHIGSALSCTDILAVLYGSILNYNVANPMWSQRDRFLLGKGHGALALYAALYEIGLLSKETLFRYQENGFFLPGQPVMNLHHGIEASSGSLGHMLSLGEGIALFAKNTGADYNTYVLLGDGECNEGTIWESAMSSSHLKLDNLVAIVDLNGMQSDGPSHEILNMGSLSEKWDSFGWNVLEVNGHDTDELCTAFHSIRHTSKPNVILANTIKVRRVSFMENNTAWHHNHLSIEQYILALYELGGEASA